MRYILEIAVFDWIPTSQSYRIGKYYSETGEKIKFLTVTIDTLARSVRLSRG